MEMYRVEDTMLCRAFPNTLPEKARSWFLSLFNSFFFNLGQISKTFLGDFIENKRRTRISFSLLSVTYKHGEFLRNYIKKFTNAYSEIMSSNNEIAIKAFNETQH